jgi:hypothetical protein
MIGFEQQRIFYEMSGKPTTNQVHLNQWKKQQYVVIFYLVSLLMTYCYGTQSSVTRNKYFDDFDSFSASSTANPVDEWLSSSPVAGADGLQWWAAVPTHPLHHMAMNFLSIPGVVFELLC